MHALQPALHHDDALHDDLLSAAMALGGRRLAILTGAGISTDSGIPDYRGEGTRQRARRPVRFAEYVASEHARKRYWARAFVGWQRLRDAVDNAGHRRVGALVASRRANGCITQNVDGLHTRGGADVVVELHGALRSVRCLGCNARSTREALQHALAARNATWLHAAEQAARDKQAPDGDVDLDDDVIAGFVVVDCDVCGGALKPDVVFFGENVERDVVARAAALVDDAEALLVLGTSLEVWSGRRFVMQAQQRRLPIVIVNRGPTRADDVATVKIDAGIAETLSVLLP
ncbi:MAG TPA: NAD-dependent protein deacetylase [Myxococcota bacterium]